MSSISTAQRPDIVITGAGLVTCLGRDRWETWRGICELRDGFGPLSELEQRPPIDKGGGQAVPLPDDFAADLPREARYLRHVINAAVKEAGIADLPYPPERCGLVMGTTLHGMRAAGQYFRSQDPHDLRTFLAPSILRLAAGQLGFSGFAATTCSACSSGLGSVALAMTLLQTGELDLVIAGGYDVISEYTYAGFNSLRLIADDAVRPFCRGRRGLKIGEGYAAIVLERAGQAAGRGAKTLAHVLAAGESADAHHLTQPRPDGQGAMSAMRAALSRATLGPNDIGLICAHATGTPDNDSAEYAALRSTFGEQLERIPCVAFKSHLGHTLGAAGAVELILALMAMNEGVLPPTRHAPPADVEFAGLALLSAPRSGNPQVSLNLSIGFGGANTCVLLGAPKINPVEVSEPAITALHLSSSKREERDVFITGVGVVLPGAIGNTAFVDLMDFRGADRIQRRGGAVADDDLLPLLQSRRVRRMSQYVKLTLAATAVAFRDAEIEAMTPLAESFAAVLGTAHSSVEFSSDFYRQVVEQGIDAANPALFAEGVPNAGAAQLSLMTGAKGPCQTILGTRTAGLDALRLAWLRVRSGEWERAIVCAADEYTPLVNKVYESCGLYGGENSAGAPFESPTGFTTSAGAGAFILESRASMEGRGIKPRGRVTACASAAFSPENLSAAVEEGRRVVTQLGSPSHIISSANGTWLDRLESAVLKSDQSSRVPTVSSLYGYTAETFSAGPLAAVALPLLTGRLPRLLGAADGKPSGFQRATGVERASDFGVLCSDYNGLWAGTRLEVAGERIGGL